MRLLLKYIAILIFTGLFVSCSQSVRFSSNAYSKTGTEAKSNPHTEYVASLLNNQDVENTGRIFRGIASYYGDKFEGRTTASGEIYTHDKFTAAHKTLKFGTKLRVTNISNSNSVYVTVNDRGPFAEGRIIDLSKAAAIILDMLDSGLAEVEIEIIE